NIPVMMRVEISGSRNIYYSTSVKEKHLPMLKKMERLNGVPLSEKNKDYFRRLQKSFTEGASWEIKEQSTFRKNQKNRWVSLFQLLKKLPLLVPKLFRPTNITMKTKKIRLQEESNGFNYLQLLLYFFKARRKIKQNEKIYKSMVESPNFDEKYVLFSSSYQPERTTCPDASYYTDLLLIIDILAKSIPGDWKIYYKEHPTNFLHPNNKYFFRGHMFRSKEFFEKVKSYPQVKIVDVASDNYKLIDNSQAVATASGTSALEAAVRGKVGMIFGNSWFEGCDGVFRIKTLEDSKLAISKANSGYKADLDQIMRFREAFMELTKDCPIETDTPLGEEDFSSSYARFVKASKNNLDDLGLL
ncbi:MAG: hypothetical protein HRT44_12120, partial [Bdellovibrionales bacterium]|nr:capsular biosynthesis protein [Bdellovibrionales bacterium]NQZ19985.1 hypothetical protein [Bdellovibrionales bacterium]